MEKELSHQSQFFIPYHCAELNSSFCQPWFLSCLGFACSEPPFRASLQKVRVSASEKNVWRQMKPFLHIVPYFLWLTGLLEIKKNIFLWCWYKLTPYSHFRGLMRRPVCEFDCRICQVVLTLEVHHWFRTSPLRKMLDNEKYSCLFCNFCLNIKKKNSHTGYWELSL